MTIRNKFLHKFRQVDQMRRRQIYCSLYCKPASRHVAGYFPQVAGVLVDAAQKSLAIPGFHTSELQDHVRLCDLQDFTKLLTLYILKEHYKHCGQLLPQCIAHNMRFVGTQLNQSFSFLYELTGPVCCIVINNGNQQLFLPLILYPLSDADIAAEGREEV